MITASNLTKVFGTVTAIEDVSFHVAAGEIVGFLGPNGAGKTTAMRILAGVFPPTMGRASIAGHDVLDEPMEARRALGYFPEYAPFYPDLSVVEYLHFVGRMKRLDRAARRAGVERVLGSCGLDAVAGRLVGKLSKGYRQRVGLAQALLGDPRVLILDEPTAGLDPEQVVGIRSLIVALGATRAVLLSSHILSEVEAVCSRVVVLNQGRVVGEGSPEALMAQLGARQRIIVRVDAPPADVLELVRDIAGVESARAALDGGGVASVVAEVGDDAGRRAVAEVIQARGWTILELRHESLPLEEIFLRLVRSRKGGAAAMTAMVILAREVRGYFTSILAYVILGVFLVLSGYFFYTNLQLFVLMGGMDLPRGLWQYQFHDMREVLLFAVVFLTMRLFAEEKKLGTIELMWTYPVRDGAVLLGKYGAALVMVAVMLGLTLVYPVALGSVYPVAPGPLLAGYLGLFLLSAAFAACGLWASSLTESQIVAGLVSFGVLTLFWMLTWNQAAASDWVIAMFMPVSLFDRFHTFARGAIDAKDVVFLAAFSTFFLFLTLLSLESRRWRGLR